MAKAKDTGDAVRVRITKRLDHNESQLEVMGFTKESFLRLCLNALITNPNITKCDPDSVDLCIVQCLNAGLVPDGKEAAIVPFKTTATLVPMIDGKLKLARRAVPGLSVWARTVWAEDEFEHEEGMYPKLVHKPGRGAFRKDDSAIIAVYAVAQLPAQKQPEFEVMYRPEVDHFRAMSRARSGPWGDHYGEMGEKAVLGRLLKRLPKRAGDPTDQPIEAAQPAADDTVASAPALEYLPPRTLADVVPGAAAAGNGAQPAKARTKTRGGQRRNRRPRRRPRHRAKSPMTTDRQLRRRFESILRRPTT